MTDCGPPVRGGGGVGRWALLGLVALLVAPHPGSAQGAPGLRVGGSLDPDQVFFGGHVETGPLADRLTFRPNAEVGVGDDLIVIALNAEFVYRMPRRGADWGVYVGAGPAVNFFDFDDGRGRSGDSDLEPGFNILLGAEHTDGLFAEFKVGALDSPDLKFTVGFTF